MIALSLDGAEDLGETFYLAYKTVNDCVGPLWHDLKRRDQRRWIKAAQRVIALYRVEGLTMGVIGDAGE